MRNASPNGFRSPHESLPDGDDANQAIGPQGFDAVAAPLSGHSKLLLSTVVVPEVDACLQQHLEKGEAKLQSFYDELEQVCENFHA